MNLVYIHTHDSGRYLSPYGYKAPTENIMKFAQKALTFTNAYCVGPTCSPSRAGLLTGTYPHQNGMLGLAQRGFGLNDYDKHLCRFLKRNDFHTVLSGIQHEVGHYLNVTASRQLGYDEVLTISSDGFKLEELNDWDSKNADKVVDWLEKYDQQKPFFISYGMHSTHRPFPIEVDEVIDENYVKPCSPIVNNELTRHDFSQYLTSAKNADECFGKIITAIEANRLSENTIIILTTDHGLPYLFNKCNLTDKGIGVCLIMKVPAASTNGEVTDSLISHIDVFPTICDLLKLEKPDYLEGKSFAPIFEGENVDDEYIFAGINFHASYEPSRCVRTKRYKYIRYYDRDYLKVNINNYDDNLPKDFYIDNSLHNVTKAEEALYDLYYDPEEQHNLIDEVEMETVIETMREKLQEFQVNTNDPLLKGYLDVLPHYKVNKKEVLHPSSKDPEDYDPRGKFY